MRWWTIAILAAAVGLFSCSSSDNKNGQGGSELETPRSELPQGLVGSWFSGTISSIQFYDPYSGSWAPPNGSGFYYIFSAQGDYETGAVINSTQYNCTMQLLGRAVGTVTIDGDEIVFYQHNLHSKVTNTCGSDGETVKGAEVDTYRYELGVDEYNKEVFRLIYPTGDVSTFYRWE